MARDMGTSPRTTPLDALEYAVSALRSNQDVLLHKVARTQVVREQLEVNRTAIQYLKDALKEACRDAR